MIEKDDWRLERGQIEYLKDKELIYTKYTQPSKEWDHDHCAFCWKSFSILVDSDLHEGYCTLDRYTWICPECFEDFKEMFNWKVIKH